MHRFFFILFSVVLLLSFDAVAEAQNLRCTYRFQFRNATDDKFRVSDNRKLDCFNGRFAFYEENVFLADSLENIVYDEKGKIINQQAYAERTLLPSSTVAFRDVSITDHHAGTFLQCYQTATVFVIGNANMELPAWELQEDTCTVAGYYTQKAVADYMGRRWEIRFAPDIPLTSGPWLLWGAPGLIVQANDADNLFHFELRGVEELDSPSRIDFLKWFHAEREKSKRKQFSLPLPRAESIYYKIRTDINFFNEAAGLPGRKTYRVDSSGEKRDVTFPAYTPLIPVEYWKKR